VELRERVTTTRFYAPTERTQEQIRAEERSGNRCFADAKYRRGCARKRRRDQHFHFFEMDEASGVSGRLPGFRPAVHGQPVTRLQQATSAA
jgi:hypothetical protein